MQALITGVAGFIGAHVAEEMLARGWRVAGLDDLSGGSRANVPEQVEFLQYDCCQPLDAIFRKFQPQVVVHLAAYAAEGLSHHIPNFNYHNNLIGTSNVLAAAYRTHAQHFVFTSSIAAYGHPAGDAPLAESMPCQPCDPYGVAKLACEQHIATFHEYFGGPAYTIFRPHNVFGPKQNIADPFRNVVGIFFRCTQSGQPLPVFGDGSQTRNFSYVDVVAKSIAACHDNPAARNEVFNVGGDEAITVLELAERIQCITGKSNGIEFLPERKEVKHARADHHKVKHAFPDIFGNPISIQEGLEKTAAYLENRPVPAKTPCPGPLEVPDLLPPSWRKEFSEADGSK